MGIINVTPDSFYSGSRFQGQQALERAYTMVKEGVDIIDIGGESTRPDATPVSAEDEARRVIPLITLLKKNVNVPLSIDSRHALVIEQALALGVDMVNDISGLSCPQIVALVAQAQVPVCIMHMQGTPRNMQVRPTYVNILEEIKHFFIERMATAQAAGIMRSNIYLDPGFGFGKTLGHNITLLKNLSFFKTLGSPILVGLSRKTFVGRLVAKPAEQRLFGTLAASTLALLQGASILRTHDVAATRDCIALTHAIENYEE